MPLATDLVLSQFLVPMARPRKVTMLASPQRGKTRAPQNCLNLLPCACWIAPLLPGLICQAEHAEGLVDRPTVAPSEPGLAGASRFAGLLSTLQGPVEL